MNGGPQESEKFKKPEQHDDVEMNDDDDTPQQQNGNVDQSSCSSSSSSSSNGHRVMHEREFKELEQHGDVEMHDDDDTPQQQNHNVDQSSCSSSSSSSLNGHRVMHEREFGVVGAVTPQSNCIRAIRYGATFAPKFYDKNASGKLKKKKNLLPIFFFFCVSYMCRQKKKAIRELMRAVLFGGAPSNPKLSSVTRDHSRSWHDVQLKFLRYACRSLGFPDQSALVTW